MSYINLKERYFLIKELIKLAKKSNERDRFIITSILNKIGHPEIVFTFEETDFLKDKIDCYLDEAMDHRDEHKIEFLKQLKMKV
ncbi:hypothetical protein ACFO25_14420 [Paenactinomyces guangxiensis]|uniref:Uncharacterized protein n=1 Tax=Paenactinomyces guangxiensis TaxID=1490290 RepID=A0A7W2A7T6_9BACL|nr:hypothetical protein [Paenactinomyces guangxiensis]MBA4493940.1 hypothetical protein [Paenactinomyces guangxiensis]MBH8591407.1 hypothetical protein [Paenactinomyces guangxiensis]